MKYSNEKRKQYCSSKAFIFHSESFYMYLYTSKQNQLFAFLQVRCTRRPVETNNTR